MEPPLKLRPVTRLQQQIATSGAHRLGEIRRKQIVMIHCNEVRTVSQDDLDRRQHTRQCCAGDRFSLSLRNSDSGLGDGVLRVPNRPFCLINARGCLLFGELGRIRFPLDVFTCCEGGKQAFVPLGA